jgi:hypothetical protein
MKKLLALVLVLSVVSIANAGLTFTYDSAAKDLVITNVAPAATLIQGYPYLLLASATVEIPGTAVINPDGIVPFKPDMAGIFMTGSDAIGYVPGENAIILDFSDSTLAAGGVFTLGKWATVDVNGSGMVDVWQFDENLDQHTLLGTVDVPEPITMSLLALGGLVALRRRK